MTGADLGSRAGEGHNLQFDPTGAVDLRGGGSCSFEKRVETDGDRAGGSRADLTAAGVFLRKVELVGACDGYAGDSHRRVAGVGDRYILRGTPRMNLL